MKTVYFVRHGQSMTNAEEIRIPDAPLSDIGKEQAKRVSASPHFKKCEVILSSTKKRARETTEIINKELNLPVEYSELLIERERPTFQYNKRKDDPACREADRLFFDNFCENNFHYEDEENYSELKNRAEKILEIIKKRPENTILVVTHGFILRILLSLMIHQEHITPKVCLDFLQQIPRTKNTGITIATFDGNWQVLTWNDYNHLLYGN